MNRLIWRIIVALIIVIAAAIAVVALTNDEAAEEVDQAAQDLREAGEDLGDAAENIGDAAEITGEEVEEAAEESGVKEAAEEAGEEVGAAAGDLAEEGTDRLEEGADELEEETDKLADDKTVIEVIREQPQLSTFASAVDTTTLADTLNGAGPFTVFAPTNAALQAYPNFNALLQNNTALQNFILSHVVNDEVTSAEMSNQQLQSSAGQTISVSVTESGVVLNGTVRITVTDLEAENGVVHIIDGVLTR